MEVTVEFAVNVMLALLFAVIASYYVSETLSASRKNAANGSGVEGRKASAAAQGSAREAKQLPHRRPDARPEPPRAPAAADVAKVKSSEVYTGVVQRYSERNGMGFISCPTLREKHDADVRVFREEVEPAGLKVGDRVTFRAVLGGRAQCRANHPWATEVARAPAEDPQDASVPPPQAPQLPAGSSSGASASAATGRLRPEAAEWIPASPASSGSSPAVRFNPDAQAFVPGAASRAKSFNPAAATFVPGAPVSCQAGASRLSPYAHVFVPTSAAVQ